MWLCRLLFLFAFFPSRPLFLPFFLFVGQHVSGTFSRRYGHSDDCDCTVACPLINCSFFLRSKIFFYWSFFPNFFFCVIIKSKLTSGHNLTIVKFSSRFTHLGLMLLDPQQTAIEHKMNMVLLKFAHGATSNAQHYLKILCTMITKPPSKSKFYVDFKTIYIFSKITKLTHLLSSHVLRLLR